MAQEPAQAVDKEGRAAPRHRRYIKPLSLTWWASAAPLAIGLMIATEPLHGLSALVATLRNVTGDAPPAMLINAGLVGIGLRGALQ